MLLGFHSNGGRKMPPPPPISPSDKVKKQILAEAFRKSLARSVLFIIAGGIAFLVIGRVLSGVLVKWKERHTMGQAELDTADEEEQQVRAGGGGGGKKRGGGGGGGGAAPSKAGGGVAKSEARRKPKMALPGGRQSYGRVPT